MSKKKTHQEYLQDLEKINSGYEPIEQYQNAYTKIKHKCKKCGCITTIEPHSVLTGHNCPICCGRIIGPAPEYKNSIYANEQEREYFSQFLTEEQMKNYAPQSSKKVIAECPNCHRKREIAVGTLYREGICCKYCGNSVSYPNKFIYALLDQLDIKYIKEYQPKWSNKRRYDIYIPDKNMIIENNGLQHYEGKTSFGDTTLEEVQKNDAYKKELAIKNGIQNYIELDCRVSQMSYIKNSIANSKIPSFLSFSVNDIDWRACGILANSSTKLNDIVELYKLGFSPSEIGEKINMNRRNVRLYLKKARELGLCDYIEGERRRKPKIKKEQACFCLETGFISKTLKEMSEKYKIDKKSISDCVTGRNKTASKKHFYSVYDRILPKSKRKIQGAISLGLITEEYALSFLQSPDGSSPLINIK